METEAEGKKNRSELRHERKVVVASPVMNQNPTSTKCHFNKTFLARERERETTFCNTTRVLEIHLADKISRREMNKNDLRGAHRS